MIPARRSTDPALQYVPQPTIEPPGSQSDMSTFAKAHNIEGIFDPKQYDTVAISRYLRIKFREYEAEGDQDKNLHELLVNDFGHWEVDDFNKADVRSISIVRQFCMTRGIWIGTPGGPSNTRGKTVWRAINSDYYPNWTMEQIIKVQDDYKSISTGIHIRKGNLLGTTPFDNPSAVQIRTPSEQSCKRGSPVNQPQMSQPHMAQTLNPNLYRVPPPEVIMDEPSAGPEFVTPLTYREEEQPSTQEAHGYYEVPTVKDEPVNLENFDNPRYKYREEEDYVPRQRFTRRGQEERLPHQSTQPRPWSRVPLQPTVPEYQSSYRQSVPPPVPHQSSVPVPRPPDAPVPQPHYPSFTAPLPQRNPTPYVSINTNDSHLPSVDYSRQLANLGKAYQKEEKYYGLGDNFTLKLKIFYDRCEGAGLPPEAYIKGVTYMVTGEAMTAFYKVKHPAMTFEDFCRLMKEWYETPEWKRNNQIKWETITLAKVIERNPTLSIQECLRKMCKEMDDLQQGLNSEHQGPRARRENLIRACRGHPTLLIGLSHAESRSNYTDVVNALDSAIVEYELVHNPSAVQQTYVQDKEQDVENYFTDRTFRKHNFSSNNRGRPTDERYGKRWSQEKKCWVCHKPDCWSTNHSASEIEESKKRFGNKHPEYKKRSDYECRLRQYMFDFEGEDPDDGFAQYFEELCITTETPEEPQTAKTNYVCETYY